MLTNQKNTIQNTDKPSEPVGLADNLMQESEALSFPSRSFPDSGLRVAGSGLDELLAIIDVETEKADQRLRDSISPANLPAEKVKALHDYLVTTGFISPEEQGSDTRSMRQAIAGAVEKVIDRGDFGYRSRFQRAMDIGTGTFRGRGSN